MHTYRHTLVGLHICPGIGMLMYVVYKHTYWVFLHPQICLCNMLIDTCSSSMHVYEDETFFTTCFTNLHLEGLHQCPRIRHAQVYIYTMQYIHKEIELFIVMVYTHTLVDVHTCANIVLLCKRIGTYTRSTPECPGPANSACHGHTDTDPSTAGWEVEVRGVTRATEDGGLTVWHHGDLLHVVAQQVVQRSAQTAADPHGRRRSVLTTSNSCSSAQYVTFVSSWLSSSELFPSGVGGSSRGHLPRTCQVHFQSLPTLHGWEN